MRLAPIAALAAALLVLAAGGGTETPAAPAAPAEGGAAGEREPLADYEFSSCWGCHEAITDEWARSLHALAWERPRYQEALRGRRRPETCHGCHVPERLQGLDLPRKPKPRSEDLEPFHFGISCKSCHLGEDGAMLGPIADPLATEAHGSAFSRGFTESGSNALCISCHATTVGPVIGIARDFERVDAEDRSCVGCHMDPVERSMAVGDDDEPAPVRRGRSHRLNGPSDPAFLATAFELAVEGREGATLVHVANAAGHGVPGLVGRAFLFEAELLDGDGTVLAAGGLEITTRAPLPVDERLAIRLDGTGPRVRVTAAHRPEEGAEPLPFLETTLDVASPAK